MAGKHGPRFRRCSHAGAKLRIVVALAISCSQNSAFSMQHRSPARTCFVEPDPFLLVLGVGNSHNSACSNRRSIPCLLHLVHDSTRAVEPLQTHNQKTGMRSSFHSDRLDSVHGSGKTVGQHRGGRAYSGSIMGMTADGGGGRPRRSLDEFEEKLSGMKAKLKAAREGGSATDAEINENWEKVLGVGDLPKELKLRMWKDKSSAAREKRGWKPEDTIERIIEEQREHMESSELEQFNSPPAMPPPRAPPPSFSSTTQSARSDVSEDRATAPSQSAMQQARQRSASSQMQSPVSFKGSAEREPADAISGEEDAGEEGKDRRSRPLTSGDNQPAPRPQTEVPVQRRGRTGAGIALCLAARSGKLDGLRFRRGELGGGDRCECCWRWGRRSTGVGQRAGQRCTRPSQTAISRWSGCSSRREQIASSRMQLAPHPKMKPGGSAGLISSRC